MEIKNTETSNYILHYLRLENVANNNGRPNIYTYTGCPRSKYKNFENGLNRSNYNNIKNLFFQKKDFYQIFCICYKITFISLKFFNQSL